MIDTFALQLEYSRIYSIDVFVLLCQSTHFHYNQSQWHNNTDLNVYFFPFGCRFIWKSHLFAKPSRLIGSIAMSSTLTEMIFWIWVVCFARKKSCQNIWHLTFHTKLPICVMLCLVFDLTNVKHWNWLEFEIQSLNLEIQLELKRMDNELNCK